MRKNVYKHSIDLKKLNINNLSKEKFIEKLIEIPYRGYEVEILNDGRKIVITKPGGKRKSYGQVAKEDFIVFIYEPSENTLWQISHKQIFEDLKNKSEKNVYDTIQILEAIEKVYNGEDPIDILKNTKLTNPYGETPEALLKVLKWIFGQEDVNYPNGEGRFMCWKELKFLLEELKKNT